MIPLLQRRAHTIGGGVAQRGVKTPALGMITPSGLESTMTCLPSPVGVVIFSPLLQRRASLLRIPLVRTSLYC
ncbi:MAG TPA: hypothetical protein PLD47_17985 [Aggregatilineales bacterium]|nr:hypothetical protein [Anaerolineales bacterium]HRE49619.1 hypothetical protein [Aggregatilineales bacterium]